MKVVFAKHPNLVVFTATEIWLSILMNLYWSAIIIFNSLRNLFKRIFQFESQPRGTFTHNNKKKKKEKTLNSHTCCDSKPSLKLPHTTVKTGLKAKPQNNNKKPKNCMADALNKPACNAMKIHGLGVNYVNIFRLLHAFCYYYYYLTPPPYAFFFGNNTKPFAK